MTVKRLLKNSINIPKYFCQPPYIYIYERVIYTYIVRCNTETSIYSSLSLSVSVYIYEKKSDE